MRASCGSVPDIREATAAEAGYAGAVVPSRAERSIYSDLKTVATSFETFD